MKKLLSILASVGLTASAATVAVACSTTQNGSSIHSDKSGDVSFNVKVTLSRFSYLAEQDKNNYKVIDPQFALMPTKDVKGQQNNSPVVNPIKFTMTVNKKYLKGVFDAKNPGPLKKDVRVVANVKFQVTPEIKTTKQSISFVKTDRSGKTIDEVVKKMTIEIPGTGAHPVFSNASYDAATKTITVNGNDITKIEGGFDKSKLTIDGPDKPQIDSVNATDQNVTIVLKEALKQYKDEKHYKIAYTGNSDLSTTLTTEASTIASNADYDNDLTITVKGSNLGADQTVTDNVTINDAEDLIDKAEIKSGDLVITLKAKIEKTFAEQDFKIAYTLDSKDEVDSKLVVLAKQMPDFISATYDNNKTVTINGSDIDNFDSFDGSKLKITDLTVASAKVSDDKKQVIATLDKAIPEYNSDKSYTVSYDDGTVKTKTNPSFTVKATTLEGTANYDGDKTITINGSNLEVNDDVKSQVTSIKAGDTDITSTIASAKTDNDKLTITLSSAITKTFEDQKFSVDYKFTGEGSQTSTFTVSKDSSLEPTLSTATYSADKKEIDIDGTHLDQYKGTWDKSHLTGIDASLVDSVSSTDATHLVVKLTGPIPEKDSATDYTIAYTDGDFSVTAKPFTVKAKSVFTGATLSGTTIKVTGNNFLTTDNSAATVQDSLQGKNIATKTEVKSATEIDITISEPEATYYAENKLSVDITNDGIEYKQDLTVPKNGKVPAFTSASYDGKTTVTVKGTNLDQITTWDKTKFTGLSVDSAASTSDTLTITLTAAIAQTGDEQTIKFSYNDGQGTTLSSSFTVHKAAAKFTSTTANTTDNKEFTIAGQYLPTTVDKSNLTVTEDGKALEVAAATSTADQLTITLAATVDPTFDDQTINFSYSPEGTPLTATYTVKAKAAPTFSGATFDDTDTIITISGTNIPTGITGSDLSVDNGGTAISGFSITKNTDTQLVITLGSAIAKTRAEQTINIKYTYTTGKTISTSATIAALSDNMTLSLGTAAAASDGKSIVVKVDPLIKAVTANDVHLTSTATTVSGVKADVNASTIEIDLSKALNNEDTATLTIDGFKNSSASITVDMSSAPAPTNNEITLGTATTTDGITISISLDKPLLVAVSSATLSGETTQGLSVGSVTGNKGDSTITVILKGGNLTNADTGATIAISGFKNASTTIDVSKAPNPPVTDNSKISLDAATISPDGLTITVSLKDGAKLVKAVEAGDITLSDTENSDVADASNIASVAADVDATSIVITLTKPAVANDTLTITISGFANSAAMTIDTTGINPAA